MITDNQVAALINCVENYSSVAEYCKYNNCTEEEFAADREANWITDITCGTYNGASDTFTPWELTDSNVIEMLRRDMIETDFLNEMADYFEPADVDTLEKQLTEYMNFYNFFTIDGRLYSDNN